MRKDNQFIRLLYGKYLAASFFGILCSAVGQVANSIIVGNLLGVEALGILSLVLPIYYIFATVGNLLGIGASALASSLTGKGEHSLSRKAFTSAYVLTFGLAVVLTGLVLGFLPGLVRLIGTPPALFEQTFQYCVVMALGGIFTMGVYLAFNFLRLDGKTGASMLVFAVMAVVNVVLDVLFCGVFGMGIVGVSLATSLGAAAASVMGAVLLFCKSRNFSLVWPGWTTFWRLVWDMTKLGSPGAMENICILLRSLLLNQWIQAGFGAFALSAFSVVGTINSFALSVIAGTAGAVVPFVGVFAAERDTKSIRQVLFIALVQGGGMTLLLTGICLVGSGWLGALFGMGDVAAQAVVRPAIALFSLSFLPALVGSVLTSLHLANGHTAIANVITALRQLVLVVGAVVVLSSCFGEHGIWHGFWVAEVATLLAAGLMHLFASWHKPDVSPWTLLDERTERRGNVLSFSVGNSVASIMERVAQAGAFCEAHALSPKRSMLITLSLEEMLLSIREHSLCGDERLTMQVRLVLLDDVIVLRIRNGGAEFNPIAYYEQKAIQVDADGVDAMLALEDSLGIKMICDAADVVDYRRTFGVNNLTVIC